MPPSPSERASRRLPPHLRRYVVPQEYASYTPRDHAVWRHVLRRLVRHLATRAHEAYRRGLAATGIGTERIPSLDEMNERLERLGWSAVCVRGFIPPAVFTELQSMRVLAIAGDIRTHEHVEYTPAPDIIHESAGHAPILADPGYAAFLQRVGELGFRAIASAEDDEVYQAIRALSIVKEDPAATPAEVAAADERLAAAMAARHFVSEATRASRLYWWTAEYGLVGSLDDPRIYGAGLLSSIGESTHCFSDQVERLPLDVGAAEVDFDITRMQPQLFVVRELAQLTEVVEALAETLSWRRGGEHGLRQALAARTVNHVVLPDGIAVTGVVSALHPASHPGPGRSTAVAVLDGPVQLSRGGRALGEAVDAPAVIALGDRQVPPDGPFRLAFEGGLRLSGRMVDGVAVELRGAVGSRELPLPTRAVLRSATAVPSVAGGPGDPGAWDERFGAPVGGDEGEARARAHRSSALPAPLAALYAQVRAAREAGRIDPVDVTELRRAAAAWPDEWLLRTELDELAPAAARGAPDAVEAGAAPASEA